MAAIETAYDDWLSRAKTPQQRRYAEQSRREYEETKSKYIEALFHSPS